MSVSVMAWVFSSSAATTNATEQAVLLAIADQCDDEGRGAYPGVPTIAKKARVTERCVFRVIERLKARGILSVTTSASRRGTNVYRVVMTPPDPCTACTPEPRSGTP